MRIRAALAGIALAAVLLAGIASPAAQASVPAPVGAPSVGPVQMAAGWHNQDWYWLYDRCMDTGLTLFGDNGIRYRCTDLGAGRWMLQYWL
ncbi:hypothetical protein ACFXPY_45435 [Streptomyces sp. NPDC059153]|uniref:hypothetical protein n=1 Tax=Streptomyces sp. NPDC059153 TaxID=3346743 RepID=UPI00368782BB